MEAALGSQLGGWEEMISTGREAGSGLAGSHSPSPTGLRASLTTLTERRTASLSTAPRSTSGWT